MGKVQIKISSSLISMTSVKGHNDWLILERHINDGKTMGKALATLAEEHDGFE